MGRRLVGGLQAPGGLVATWPLAAMSVDDRNITLDLRGVVGRRLVSRLFGEGKPPWILPREAVSVRRDEVWGVNGLAIIVLGDRIWRFHQYTQRVEDLVHDLGQLGYRIQR